MHLTGVVVLEAGLVTDGGTVTLLFAMTGLIPVRVVIFRQAGFLRPRIAPVRGRGGTT